MMAFQFPRTFKALLLVFFLTCWPFQVMAVINDGQNAINLLGQYNSSASPATPDYTKSSLNNGPTALGFYGSVDVALDSINHRLFVLDQLNNRIMVYNLNADNTLPDGIADNVLGQPDFKSNGANLTQSGLDNPQSLAYDASGNRLFVGDGVSRVLIYDVTSITDGENAINVLGQSNFTTATPATTQSGMSAAGAIAFDSTNNRLFVADNGYHRVLVYDVTSITDGENAINVLGQANFTTATAATTQSGMSFPDAIAVDSTNNRLFVGDASNRRVLVYDIASITDGENAINVLGKANFTTSATQTTQSGFSNLRGVLYDPVGNRLFVADANNRIMVFDVSGITDGENAINVLGQANFTSSAINTTQAGLSGPSGMAYDSGNSLLYVSDFSNSRVMIYNVASITDGENAVNLLGQYSSSISSATPVYTKNAANNGPTALGLSVPFAAVVDRINHRLFVADQGNRRVLVFNLNEDNTLVDRTPDHVLGQPDFISNQFSLTQSGIGFPSGLAYDSAGNRLFVSDALHQRVLVFDVASITDGENAVNVLGAADFTTSGGALTQSGLPAAFSLAYDPDGNRLFVGSRLRNRVMVFDVASITNGENAIHVLGQSDFTSNVATTSQASTRAWIHLAYDSAGKRLFVSSNTTHRVSVFDVASITNGENAIHVLGQSNFTTATPATSQSGMSNPRGVDYDHDNSRLFVADGNNNRVLVYDVTSITDGENAIHVLGQANFTAATSATSQSGMDFPQGVSYDSGTNNLYVLDSSNNRIMVFDATAEVPSFSILMPN